MVLADAHSVCDRWLCLLRVGYIRYTLGNRHVSVTSLIRGVLSSYTYVYTHPVCKNVQYRYYTGTGG